MPANALFSIIPLIVAMGQQQVLQRFRTANATSRATAIPLSDSDRKQVQHLIRKGCLVEAAPGLYYLDEVKMRERELRGKPLVVAALVFAVVIGFFILAAILASR